MALVLVLVAMAMARTARGDEAMVMQRSVDDGIWRRGREIGRRRDAIERIAYRAGDLLLLAAWPDLILTWPGLTGPA